MTDSSDHRVSSRMRHAILGVTLVSAAMGERFALALDSVDPNSKIALELIDNADDFVDGKISPSAFAPYLTSIIEMQIVEDAQQKYCRLLSFEISADPVTYADDEVSWFEDVFPAIGRMRQLALKELREIASGSKTFGETDDAQKSHQRAAKLLVTASDLIQPNADESQPVEFDRLLNQVMPMDDGELKLEDRDYSRERGIVAKMVAAGWLYSPQYWVMAMDAVLNDSKNPLDDLKNIARQDGMTLPPDDDALAQAAVDGMVMAGSPQMFERNLKKLTQCSFQHPRAAIHLNDEHMSDIESADLAGAIEFLQTTGADEATAKQVACRRFLWMHRPAYEKISRKNREILSSIAQADQLVSNSYMGILLASNQIDEAVQITRPHCRSDDGALAVVINQLFVSANAKEEEQRAPIVEQMNRLIERFSMDENPKKLARSQVAFLEGDRKKCAELLRACGEHERAKRVEEGGPFVSDEEECFITTAVVKHIGEADNGEMLTVLRSLRDQFMMQRPKLARLVDEYYRIAPQLVARIRSRADATQIWRRLASVYLKPAVRAIQTNSPWSAVRGYVKLVKDLQREFDCQV